MAFETTAAGAVKWRVVDHAEVASHAKGALSSYLLLCCWVPPTPRVRCC